jgi:hypothetical protein
MDDPVMSPINPIFDNAIAFFPAGIVELLEGGDVVGGDEEEVGSTRSIPKAALALTWVGAAILLVMKVGGVGNVETTKKILAPEDKVDVHSPPGGTVLGV